MIHPPTMTTEAWLASHTPHGRPCVQNGAWHPDLHLVWVICDCGAKHGTMNDALPAEMRLGDRPARDEGHRSPPVQICPVTQKGCDDAKCGAWCQRIRIAEEGNQEDEGRLLAGGEVE